MYSLPILLVFVSSWLSVTANGNVPVLVWSNQLGNTFPKVLAGHCKSHDTFRNEFLHSLPEIILLISSNKVSLTDLLVEGGVFGEGDEKSLKNLNKEIHTSAYVPCVENPFSTILNSTINNGILFQNLTKELKIVGIKKALETLKLDTKTFILMELASFYETKISLELLINEVTQYLQLHTPRKSFILFYTGKTENKCDAKWDERAHGVFTDKDALRSSTEFDCDEGWKNRRSLRLLAVSDPTEEPTISDANFIISFDKLRINNPTTNNSIPLKNAAIERNDCLQYNSSEVPSAINCSVVLSLGSLAPYNDITMDLLIATSGKANEGFWYVRKVKMSYTMDSNDSVVKQEAVMRGGLADPTPFGFSYSCFEESPLVSMASVNTTQSGSVTLYFEGLQLQAFATESPRFGHYNDCIGFFSTAIWMFLITAVILISILLFGISMVMSIETMDRYDDPKGKKILVNKMD